MKYKNQHVIPASYLKAWVDPSTPLNQTGYVWKHDKITGKKLKKSPKKIFRDSNFYTVYGNDNERDLRIEKALCSIETNFISVRNQFLDSQLQLTLYAAAKLTIFVAAIFHRTEIRRDKQQDRFKHLLKVADDQANKPSSLALRKQYYEKSSKNSLSHAQIRSLSEQPMPSLLNYDNLIQTCAYLINMNSHIIFTSTPIFITSDNPGVMIDTAHNVKYLAFGSPTVEITFPISPNLMLVFFYGESSEKFKYINAEKEMEPEDIINFNHRTRLHCKKHFISHQEEHYLD